MKIFVVMIEDRHTDPDAVLFSTAEAAIDYAREYAADNASPIGSVIELPVIAWLYHARYTVEGDSVWVVEREVDRP